MYARFLGVGFGSLGADYFLLPNGSKGHLAAYGERNLNDSFQIAVIQISGLIGGCRTITAVRDLSYLVSERHVAAINPPGETSCVRTKVDVGNF